MKIMQKKQVSRLDLNSVKSLSSSALPTTNICSFVEKLSQQSGVVLRQTKGDRFGQAVTRLSGDSVKLDKTGERLIALTRSKKITGVEMLKLLSAHLAETSTSSHAVSDREIKVIQRNTEATGRVRVHRT